MEGEEKGKGMEGYEQIEESLAFIGNGGGREGEGNGRLRANRRVFGIYC